VANRLSDATSPYLLQHADNPVDWWEWGSEPFEEARRRDVPVLLSIGYAACHWCHVMAHESFEDDATAAYLNEQFVAIKVDREERPDVDAIYMNATTAMTGHGGWPMTVVLDHGAQPFFAGTYFPDRPRGGQPSFRQVLEALTEAWTQRRDQVGQVAGQLREHLNQALAAAPAPIGPDAVSSAVATLDREFDGIGFGAAPKFPPSMVLEFLLREGSSQATHMAAATLTAMARGGIHDQLAGGFARYSVDSRWVVPHFEKMLYDNALLLRVYAEWDTELGRRTAEGIADFLLAELRTSEGGFASALDADSEGAEGTFYVWTPQQLVEVLGQEDGSWAADLLSVTAAGTFEHGSSVLQLLREPDDPARWAGVRRRLLAARAERERPARDDKVVAAWNGLAISGLARAGTLLGRADLVEAAVTAAELLHDLHTVHGRLRRVSRDGVVGTPAGVLEDYGCVAAGYLDLLQATGDPIWLARAEVLIDVALTHFATDDGGFFDTADDAESLVARPRDPSDNASPSGLSSLVHALVAHTALTGAGHTREAAEAALLSVGTLAEKAPRFAGWSLAAAVALLDGPREIAVVGDPGPDRGALEAKARRILSAVVVVSDDAREDVPLLRDRHPVDGRPAAYVCRGMVCDRPVTDPAQL
jgi:uncharacterized protein YyaL (SSP411 family)